MGVQRSICVGWAPKVSEPVIFKRGTNTYARPCFTTSFLWTASVRKLTCQESSICNSPFPDHGDNGSRSHVLDEAGEEGLAGEISVVLLEVLLGSSDHLKGDELVASLLESVYRKAII